MAKTTKKSTSSKKKATGTLKKETKVKVRFIKSPASVYKIAAEPNRVKAFIPIQAKELVDNGYAEYVK